MLKNKLTVLFVFGIVFSLCSTTVFANYLSNPSFESTQSDSSNGRLNPSSYVIPVDWYYHDPYTNGTAQDHCNWYYSPINNSEAYDGTNSLYHNGTLIDEPADDCYYIGGFRNESGNYYFEWYFYPIDIGTTYVGALGKYVSNAGFEINSYYGGSETGDQTDTIIYFNSTDIDILVTSGQARVIVNNTGLTSVGSGWYKGEINFYIPSNASRFSIDWSWFDLPADYLADDLLLIDIPEEEEIDFGTADVMLPVIILVIAIGLLVTTLKEIFAGMSIETVLKILIAVAIGVSMLVILIGLI